LLVKSQSVELYFQPVVFLFTQCQQILINYFDIYFNWLFFLGICKNWFSACCFAILIYWFVHTLIVEHWSIKIIILSNMFSKIINSSIHPSLRTLAYIFFYILSSSTTIYTSSIVMLHIKFISIKVPHHMSWCAIIPSSVFHHLIS